MTVRAKILSSITFALLLFILASPLEARTVLLDGSRGVGSTGTFDDYSLMETFIIARVIDVTRSTTPLSEVDLSLIDQIVISADWMLDGAHPEADRQAVIDFVNAGGDLIVLADAPGPATEALNVLTGAFGVTVGAAPSSGGRIATTDHPTVQGISGLVFPQAASVVESAIETETVATDRSGLGVIVVRESLPGVVMVLGAPIWRNDQWDPSSENVLRKTVGWLADTPTPTRVVSWGSLKRR